MNSAIQRRLRTPVYYLLGASAAALFIAPVIWSSVKSFYTGDAPSFSNYERLLTFGEGLGVYTANSAAVTALSVLGTLVVSTLGGYGFARFEFPGKNVLFVVTLAILMIPHATLLIPIYVLFGQWGIGGSLVGLSLVLIMFQLPFSIFMMRIAFSSLPRELEEAALLDGCSSFGALRRILVRAVTPAIVTVFIFTFLASWNEFLAPLILLNDGRQFTLPVALVSLRSGDFGSVDLGALQSGIVFTALPCVAIFLVLQRYYLRGITSGAVRG